MKPRTTWAGAVIVGGLALATALPAQQKSQEELIVEREKKLAKPVFHEANWLFDYDQARAEARKQGKLLFTYFTRSYSY